MVCLRNLEKISLHHLSVILIERVTRAITVYHLTATVLMRKIRNNLTLFWTFQARERAEFGVSNK